MFGTDSELIRNCFGTVGGKQAGYRAGQSSGQVSKPESKAGPAARSSRPSLVTRIETVLGLRR